MYYICDVLLKEKCKKFKNYCCWELALWFSQTVVHDVTHLLNILRCLHQTSMVGQCHVPGNLPPQSLLASLHISLVAFPTGMIKHELVVHMYICIYGVLMCAYWLCIVKT